MTINFSTTDSVQQSCERLKDFISDTLGFGEALANVATALEGHQRDAYYALSDDAKAHVIKLPRAVREKMLVSDKSVRINLANRAASAPARIIQAVVDAFVTPQGMSWEHSDKTEFVEYLKSVVEAFGEFYNKYLAMPTVQPFSYVEITKTPSSPNLVLNFKFTMGFEDTAARVEYNWNVFDDQVVNVSDAQLHDIFASVCKLFRTVPGRDAFKVYLDQFEGHYETTKYLYQWVLLNSLHRGARGVTAELFFEEYTRMMHRNRGMVSKNSLAAFPTHIAFKDLTDVQRLYVVSLTEHIVSQFQLLQRVNQALGVQVE